MATGAAPSQLHPRGGPALTGSRFGRVTFVAGGQLHLRHAPLLSQDEGGVGVAAQWRLVLTWGTEERMIRRNVVHC